VFSFTFGHKIPYPKGYILGNFKLWLLSKNHLVFYFFVILKKRKWFLLGKEFIESFELLSPAFAKPFPVSGQAKKQPETKWNT
jgi:hypothetical protein